MHTNNQLPQTDEADHYFNTRFKGYEYSYVRDGRKAINIALQQYRLQPDDVVTIFTSSGNFYISSCVTKEIEKFCKWSRQIEPGSKLILVNHEFGYPCKNISDLKKYRLPIIEDCAHSFFSAAADDSIGTTGDFVIYSFPKMFPIQIGGVLKSKHKIAIEKTNTLTDTELRYIKNVMGHYIVQRDSIIAARMNNYHYLESRLAVAGMEPRFDLEEGTVPGVFLFSVKSNMVDLPQLKNHLYAHGIQCSVFYGEQSFFIPVHQNLTRHDLDYFIAIIFNYPQKN